MESQSSAPVLPDNPQPLNPEAFSAADVEQIIAAKLAEVDSKYADRIKALEEQLAARYQPNYVFTAHAAGPDYEIADTWSLREQEIAREVAENRG